VFSHDNATSIPTQFTTIRLGFGRTNHSLADLSDLLGESLPTGHLIRQPNSDISHIHPIYSVGRITIGPQFELIVDQPLLVLSSVVVDSGARLVVASDLIGRGDMIVSGSLYLCGSYSTQVNIPFVDILSGANFSVTYLPFASVSADMCLASHPYSNADSSMSGTNPNTETCPTVPNCIETTGRHVAVEDDVFGTPLAMHHATIIVPGTKGTTGLELSDEEHLKFVHSVASKLSDLAGGATSSTAIGYWLSPTSKSLVKEKVTQVTVYTDLSPKFKFELKNLALWCDRLY